MNIYCRSCGKVIAEDAEVRSVKSFKLQHGDSCPHCGARFSDSFNVRQEDRKS